MFYTVNWIYWCVYWLTFKLINLRTEDVICLFLKEWENSKLKFKKNKMYNFLNLRVLFILPF